MSEGEWKWGCSCLAMLVLCLVKFEGYVFIESFIPKEVTKQTNKMYLKCSVCVPVVNLASNKFLIRSFFNFASLN